MANQSGSDWHDAFHWGFGRGFWYMDPLDEVKGMTQRQLLWAPAPRIHCTLWHVGHVANRERFHIAVLLQGRQEQDVIPTRFSLFDCTNECQTGDEILDAVKSVDAVKVWVGDVRQQSHDFIDSLEEEHFNRLPASSYEGSSIAKVLMQTIGHTGVHIGRIQLLRALIERTQPKKASTVDIA